MRDIPFKTGLSSFAHSKRVRKLFPRKACHREHRRKHFSLKGAVHIKWTPKVAAW